jgi:hypothetical protein
MMAGINYRPFDEIDHQERKRPVAEQPELALRQGLQAAPLENALEEMLLPGADRNQVLSYGEFDLRYRENDSLFVRLEKVVEIFHQFHPLTRPVSWLVFVTHAHIYNALSRVAAETARYGSLRDLEFRDLVSIPSGDRESLDWRSSRDEVAYDDVLVRPFDIAETYLSERLESVFRFRLLGT